MPEPAPRESASLRILRLLQPYRRGLGTVMGLLCLLAMADMVLPLFLKMLVDDVFLPGEDGHWTLLWLILPGMGLVYVVRNMLFYVTRMRSVRISENVCFDLRKRLFDHLQQQSLRYYRSHQPGRISARLMDDTFRLQSFLQDKFPTLLRYLIEFQVLLVIVYVVNWRLALATTVVLPLHFWTYWRYRAPIRRTHSEAQEHLAAAQGNVIEKMLGVEVVKGFSAEERESRSFRKAIDASRASKIRSHHYQFSQKVVADLIVGLGTVTLLGFGAWEVKRGRMTGGEFFMEFWYIRMLYPAVQEVISGGAHLSRAAASADRVFEILDEPAPESDVADTDDAGTPLVGALEWRDVAVSYEPGAAPALENIGLTIDAGEHVAIVGPSGSGKSTMVNLLPRFIEPTAGSLLVDGEPIWSVPLGRLRRLFGLVFQEVFLFNASIEENLRYARPDASMDEVIAACELTGAHAIIERLSDGYYTNVGGSGGELSRGEKQRIALARALIRDPQVLILDEATASMDAAAARAVMARVLERMTGRTVIMITHHMELLGMVDRVIAVNGGHVVYDGPPADLPAPAPARPSMSLVEPRTARNPASGRPGLSGGAAVLLLTLSLGLAGCARTATTERSFEIDAPRTSHGVVLDSDAPVDLRRLAEALARFELDASGLPAVPADEPAIAPAAAPLGVAFGGARANPLPGVPADAITLLSLPALSGTEISELVDRLALRLNASHGYADADWSLADAVPAPPDGVTDARLLGRIEGGSTHVLRFGYRRFLSQPAQLWVFGGVIDDGRPLAVNPDLAVVGPAVTEMLAAIDELRGALTPRQLESKLVQLSYVDAGTAIAMLEGLGITTMATPAEVPRDVAFDQLPYVVQVPDPAAKDVGLIGDSNVRGGEFGLSLTPSLASPLSENNVAAPMTQLLVMYHPARPEQFSRVRSLIDDFVDRPARQIFVEGMVLEISEDGLRDLGIEWELAEGPVFWRFGSLSADGQTDTADVRFDDIDFHRVFTRNFAFDWSLQIRALLRNGKAEILSRPSVLTLNNRQSTIRVGQDIPIATSQEGVFSASNKIAFTFKYLPTGILLNIRPRVNELGTEVSMLVDTIVSSVVPGADFEIRSIDGDLLASAPTVATRRVQTYARIRNNTPFIIGGLVSRIQTQMQDKVPFLGDLPIIGAAFRSERSESEKREVIIVLTPYVLPDDQIVHRALPRNDDRFDSFGQELFRDSYRIRGDDVFDLSFLFENRRLTEYQDLARSVIRRNFRLGEREPFRSFAGDRIPGEDILVTRMLYEVAKRLEVAKKVDRERIILFERQRDVGGYDVRFLDQMMVRLGGGPLPGSFFKRMPGKAIAITYSYDRESRDIDRLATEPIPELALVDCADRDAWSKLLWDLNQPENGRSRYTVLIHDASDLVRLQRAISLKRIVTLNGGADRLLLRHYTVGKMLLMPDFEQEQVHLVDADIARFFFRTEHYYAATIHRLEEALRGLDTALRDPEIRALLAGRVPEDG